MSFGLIIHKFDQIYNQCWKVHEVFVFYDGFIIDVFEYHVKF